MNTNAGKITVLLIEDHAIVRQGCRLLLEQAGFKIVAEAAASDDGYLQFDRHKPCVVIMDLTLGGTSGMETLRRIHIRDNQARIVVFTMHDDPMLASRAMRCGATAFVTKTSPPRELVNAVQRCAVGEMYLSQDIAQSMALGSLETSDTSLAALTAREFEIFQLLADGKACSEIAELLSLSPKSVSNYSLRIKQKLGANSVADLVKIAIHEGVAGTYFVEPNLPKT